MTKQEIMLSIRTTLKNHVKPFITHDKAILMLENALADLDALEREIVKDEFVIEKLTRKEIEEV